MMRAFHFSLAAVLALTIVFPSLAAEKPHSAPTNPSSQIKKVWTNEDMDQLRARGLITTFSAAAEMSAEVPAAPPEPGTLSSRTEDPAWYARQASVLQAELDERETVLHDAQARVALAKQRITQPGIDMDKGNVGITPAAGLAILESQVRAVQDELDGLGDLARQNNIPPGDLRS
jgi:hypothetical protein